MKKLFALFLALIMALSLVACGGDTAAEDTATDDTAAEDTATDDAAASDIEVAVVLKTLSSEYWGYVKAGCDAAAADLGITVNVVGPGAESDIEGQVAQIEQQIGAGCDAIVCAPNDAGAASAALQAAIDAGIPVLAVDTNVGMEGQTCFVGTSNVDAAYEGGKWAIEQVGTDAKAVIAVAASMPAYCPLSDAISLPAEPAVFMFPPAIAVLVLAAVMVMLLAPCFLIRNLVRGDWAFPQMLMGYRRSLPEDGAHLWSLDRAEDGKVVPGTSPWDDDDAFRRLRDAGADRVWVTPMVPFVLPIAAAFAIVWVWGNPLFLLI